MRPTCSNTYRFFVAPETITGNTVLIHDADLANQMRRVLRLRPGQRVLLLDGLGSEYEVIITALEREHISGHIEHQATAKGEPATAVTLYVPLIRSERIEWVFQKATELGVSAFAPVQYTHSLDTDVANPRKRDRWQRIIREAAEQACRGKVPLLADAQPFEAACTQATATHPLTLLLWEGAAPDQSALQLRSALRPDTPALADAGAYRSLALLSGPEGGITAEELTIARRHGIMIVSLGPRILRAETAPIAALAAIFYEFEE